MVKGLRLSHALLAIFFGSNLKRFKIIAKIIFNLASNYSARCIFSKSLRLGSTANRRQELLNSNEFKSTHHDYK